MKHLRRPWRRCAACGTGICHWHDTDWVCDSDRTLSETGCGREWNSDHDPKYRAPGDTNQQITKDGVQR